MNRREIIAAAILFILSAAVIFFFVFMRSPGRTAEIYQDGKLIRTVELDSAPDEIFKVQCDGGYNIIQVKNGEISVIGASCPDKICVDHGELKSELLPIICLPNKLEITLK